MKYKIIFNLIMVSVKQLENKESLSQNEKRGTAENRQDANR